MTRLYVISIRNYNKYQLNCNSFFRFWPWGVCIFIFEAKMAVNRIYSLMVQFKLFQSSSFYLNTTYYLNLKSIFSCSDMYSHWNVPIYLCKCFSLIKQRFNYGLLLRKASDYQSRLQGCFFFCLFAVFSLVQCQDHLIRYTD